MNYQDFDLLIDRNGESLRAQVINSPAGQASADFQLPFSEDKLENFLLRLGGRARRVTRRVESQEMNAAKTFGAALFTAVFSGDVKACFRSSLDEARRQNAGLRIRLRLADPSVVDLPWEYLYNPTVNRFLALSVHTPLVRFMDLPERIQPIAVTPPIRVLVMISSPTDYPTLDVEAEWTRLNEALSDLIGKNQIAIERLDDATLEALQRKLRRERYHIFHFIGHGEFDESMQEGVLILEGDKGRGHRVSSQSLGMMLHDHESLRVAILNACEGARTSRTDPFAGSAQSLVQQGIPAVIAMQFEIADDVASRFAHEFYGALADGYPIDASLTEARKSIFAARNEVEWGTPVLYLRAPDGRIFDVDTTVPPRPLSAVDSGPQVADSSTKLTQEQLTRDLVAAARAAFAGGRRSEAIDMLRRYEPKEAVAQALRELTLENQRVADDELRKLKTAVQEHLAAASDLLNGGNLPAAWSRACDAIQLDPSNNDALALERRIRQLLDEQVAREQARELEIALRTQQEQARDAAIAEARKTIDASLAADDLEQAEKDLKAVDDAYPQSLELADLRGRVAELRRRMRLREDKRADDTIADARQEFTRSPARALGLLENFTPTHPRVSAVCRELKQLLSEQNERIAREAERRAAAARERQAVEEQRQRELRQALQRIDGYISREELPEAEAALQSSKDAFGTNAGLSELRERLLAAKRRTDADRAAQDAIARARQLADIEDHEGAIALLEKFEPHHAQVDAALETLRQAGAAAKRRKDVARRVADALARAAREPNHRAAIAGLQEALVVDPDNEELNAAIKHHRGALRGDRFRTGALTVVRSRAAMAAVVVLILGVVGVKVVPPLLTRFQPDPSQPPSSAVVVPPAKPSPANTTSTTPPGPEPAAPAAPIARPEPEPGTSKPAVEPAPVADDTSALKDAADAARRTAEGARARAVRAKATGLPRFRRADEAMARAEDLSRDERYQAAERAFNTATSLFRGSVEDVDTALASAAPIGRGNTGAGGGSTGGAPPTANPGRTTSEPAGTATHTGTAEPAEPARGNTPKVEPIQPNPTRSEPPPVRPIPLRPTTMSALEAYERALTRRDEVGLRAVYPSVPQAVIDNWSKKDSGVKYSSVRIIQTRDEFDGGPNRVRLECTFFYNFISNPGKSQTIQEKQIVVLERHGDNWDIVESRRR